MADQVRQVRFEPWMNMKDVGMITVDRVSKRYEGRLVVEDLSFNVQAGRVTGFVGPNGAGKSSTMRMMVGLSAPDSGSVSYNGIPFAHLSHPATVVGAVLDPRCMHPGRSARQHLRSMAALGGIPAERATAVLAMVGLESVAHQRVGGFSLGMRQRLALAGALLGNPAVLLLDEPANGLDPEGMRWLRGFLREFADGGGTVLVSSHLIAELGLFVDDLVVLGGGRLIAAAPVDEILGQASSTVVVSTSQPADLLRLLRQHGLKATLDDGRIQVPGATRQVIAGLAFDHQVQLDELTEVRQSLEDILLNLTTPAAQFTAA
jgi:ABC-2 type transport system ATP-binding protein